MRTRKLFLLLALVALSVALVSVLSACGDNGDTTTPAATTTAAPGATTTAAGTGNTPAATTTAAPAVTTTAAPTHYNVVFKGEDGTVIETVRYRVGDTSVTEPAVPAKAGYVGEWETYRLGRADIEVEPVYTSLTAGSEGLVFTKNADLTGYIVTGYNGKTRAVVIPATYKGEEDAVALPVVAIGAVAFRGESIIALYLPESVTAIEANAFSQCDDLKEVRLPAALLTLGDYAFFSCDKLESVVFPATLSKIPAYAFAQCVSLKSLTFETATVEGALTGVSQIAADAFSGCVSLETLVLPATLSGSNAIGSAAFLGCTGLKTLTIPNSLTTVTADSFFGCGAIETLTANAGVLQYIPNTSLKTVTVTGGTTLSLNAFKGANALEVLNLPASLNQLPAGRLDGCTSLRTITVDAANTNFVVRADGALYAIDNGAVKLVRVPLAAEGVFTVPADVTAIEASAFAGCTKLTAVTISASVTAIGDRAFYDTALPYIVIPSTVTTVTGSIANSEDFLIFCEAAEPAFATSNTSWFGIATVYVGGAWSMVEGVPTPNAD